MGIGAMCAAMLRLPLTSTLLAVVLMGVDGVAVTPQVVVAVAVAFVISNVLPARVPRRQSLPSALNLTTPTIPVGLSASGGASLSGTGCRRCPRLTASTMILAPAQ